MKLRQWIRRGEDWWARERLRRRGLGWLIDHIIAANKNTGAHGIDYPGMLRLYDVLRKIMPDTVWEFGSGTSTHFIAHALKDNGRGILHSMESEHTWAENTRRCIPKSLASFCDVIESPSEYLTLNGTDVCRHTVVPDAVPQVVYLDGPFLPSACQGAIDLLAVEERFAPGAIIVVDGRDRNVAYLLKHFRRKWTLDSILGPSGIAKPQHFLELTA
tara:strand:+ start:4095 stop:4742 length:648 start_codon:yes stop_codon:yes gene_type:complete